MTDEAKKIPALKNAMEYIPAISIFIIVLALLKQIVYYLNFDVPIKYFMGISELTVVISDNLLLAIPVTLFLIMLFFVIDKQESKAVESSEEERERIKKKADFARKINKKIGKVLIAMMVITLSLLFFADSYIIKVIIILSFSYQLLFYFPVFFLDKTLKIDRKLGEIKTLFVVYFCSFYIVLISVFEISKVEKGFYTGTQIVTQDSTYLSTSHSYFIGKTENYVFIHNKKESNVLILPAESIKKIILKSNR